MELMDILKNHDVKRFIKVSVTIILSGVIVVYGEDPRYIVLAPFIDRARAYIFRKLNID